MDFALTQAQQELSSLARRILGDRATPERLAELEAAEAGFDEELWSELASAGILTAALPERVGGDGSRSNQGCLGKDVGGPQGQIVMEDDQRWSRPQYWIHFRNVSGGEP